MAIEKKSIKDSLKFKPLDCSDDFFSLKGEQIITTDMFSFTCYDAMRDVQDVRTNNYSNLVLTKKQRNSNWLQTNQKRTAQVNLVTTLSFFSDDPEYADNPGAWVYFDKTYEFWDVYLKSAPYAITISRPTEAIYNYIFYVDFIDETHCKISHNFGDLTFYMSVSEDRKIEFITDSDDSLTLFSYVYDDNKLRLFKVIEGVTYALKIALGDEGYYLSISDDLSVGVESVLYTSQVDLDFDFYVNASFIGYDRSKSISSINREFSAFNLDSQNLLHHQYNTDNGVNFIPLKNAANYQGDFQRGANLTISYEGYPDVDYRSYNSIHSGINQELGNDNIILNYHFTDQVYRVNDGEIVEFYIPTKDENEGKNPLWPYEKINIADSKFVKNGAFASNVPFFADKVKKMQGKHTILLNEDGERLSPNNGVYLCTWLYQANEHNPAIWLDRYYYPDVISRKEALLSPHYEQSFENVIDKNYRTPEVVELIKENTYFDKVSDMVIEPGNAYQFVRLSSEMVNEVVEALEPNLIQDAIANTNDSVYLNDRVVFDSKTWMRINHKEFNKTNKVNMNFDLYLDGSKPLGIQLFGTDYKSGLTISNRKDLSPFHYYATDKEIYLLNNKFEIRRKFDLYSKYNDTISKFILGDVFDDVVVISNLYIYIFTYDLKIKSKIDYKDILGIEDVLLDNNEPLLGYPYTGMETEIPYVELESVDVTDMKAVVTYPINGRFNTSVNIPYANPEGEMFFETNISRILCEGNSITYNNNIYAPHGNSVLKIIFTPDAKKDNFTWDERDEFPCKIRKLDEDEIHYNFIKFSSEVSTDMEPSVENGFIEVENRIKTLYVSNKGDVYGFNFDLAAMSCDGDTMYGLYGWEAYVKSGGWFWLYNQSLSKIKASIKSSKFAEFASDNSIDFVRFHENGSMALIRNFHNLPTNTNSDNWKRLEIYDKSKKNIYNYDLSRFTDIFCLDSYTYIDEDYNEQPVFVALGIMNGIVYKVEYQCAHTRVVLTRTELPLNKNERFVETTNSNTLVRHAGENKLYFNLFLPSDYLYDYCETITFDMKDIQTGWYNFNVSVDLDNAEFAVKVNDVLLEERYQTELFVPYVNSNGTIFDTTYYVGCVGKKYGTTMGKILSDSNFDPYACKNIKMENLTLYTKTLDYYEYQAMRLYGKKVNPISLTLPCGQRNNIEEIVRYFKYVAPQSIANSVKINVSGTGLTTAGEFDLLEKEIRQALENELDCLVDVKQIQFIR